MLRRLYENSGGDTIVEVMIVLAVLGLALGISYATANRSLLNARQAQENSQATEMTQTQVEDLSLLAPTSGSSNTSPTSNIFLPSQPYCIRDARSASPIVTGAANCTFGESSRYTVLVYNCDKLSAQSQCQDVGGQHSLVVQAKWPDVNGEGEDTVTLVYKAHPDASNL